MKSYLKTVNYSSSNEDSFSELRALQITERDSILCITGSGARPLDLLIQRPNLVVSIDFNPCQNFLLELKMRAIEQLDYEEFLEFIGICDCQSRQEMYASFRKRLTPEACSFWDKNIKMVEKGVIYQGRWERYFRRLSRIVCLARPSLLEKLFACQNIREQTRIWHEGWNDSEWQAFLSLVSSRAVWKYFFRDPGFYRYVPCNFSISAYNLQKFSSAFENLLIRKSPYAKLLFFGKYNPDGPLPPHLQREHYGTIKGRLSSIQIVTQSLGEFLERSRNNRFDKYSLSDFSSYTNGREYRRIWKEVINTAAERARICERQFLVKREIPGEFQGSARRDFALEEELNRTDNSFFFTFVIAKVERRGNA